MTTNNVASLCLNSPPLIDISFSKKTIIKGVYIWGYADNINKFIPIYVGKSRNIFERILQHYVRFGRGEYQIPQWLQKNCGFTPASNYVPSSFKEVYDFNNNPSSSAKQTVEYILENFRFIYHETDDNAFAEKYLAEKIGEKNLITQVPSMVAIDAYKELDNLIKNCF